MTTVDINAILNGGQATVAQPQQTVVAQPTGQQVVTQTVQQFAQPAIQQPPVPTPNVGVPGGLMAKLKQLDVQASIQAATNEVVPAGTYKATLDSVSIEENKNKTNVSAKSVFTIIEGPHINRKLYNDAWLLKKDGTPNDYAVKATTELVEKALKLPKNTILSGEQLEIEMTKIKTLPTKPLATLTVVVEPGTNGFSDKNDIKNIAI